jgi:hypothetical protein
MEDTQKDHEKSTKSWKGPSCHIALKSDKSPDCHWNEGGHACEKENHHHRELKKYVWNSTEENHDGRSESHQGMNP